MVVSKMDSFGFADNSSRLTSTSLFAPYCLFVDSSRCYFRSSLNVSPYSFLYILLSLPISPLSLLSSYLFCLILLNFSFQCSFWQIEMLVEPLSLFSKCSFYPTLIVSARCFDIKFPGCFGL